MLSSATPKRTLMTLRYLLLQPLAHFCLEKKNDCFLQSALQVVSLTTSLFLSPNLNLEVRLRPGSLSGL